MIDNFLIPLAPADDEAHRIVALAGKLAELSDRLEEARPTSLRAMVPERPRRGPEVGHPQ